jgi:hypothetical protein
MEQPNPYELLLKCPVAEEAVWLEHVAAFTAAFITSAKRERWLELLTKRPRRIVRQSHKMHSDLDRRTCRNVGEVFPAGLKGAGLFYDFSDPPRVVSVELAAQLAGRGRDAIFSLVPGELALYFFHEGEVWFCQARGKGA